MSARLIRRLLESDLPAELKPTAVVLVLFGDTKGESIYPSVDRVAWMLGRTRRQANRALQRLRQLSVFEAQTSGKGGRNKATIYRLNTGALPMRPTFFECQAFERTIDEMAKAEAQKNPDVHVNVSTDQKVDVCVKVSATETLDISDRNPDILGRKP